MTSLYSLPHLTISYLVITFFTIFLAPTGFSQDPSIAQCGTSLLPLAPCAPFVQGLAQSPPQLCCTGLRQLYNQDPHCLCLLLNNTGFTSFPINRTLAVQLPSLCSLQVDNISCSGVNVAPSPPASQVSLGTNTSSTHAASPMGQHPTARLGPTVMGLGSSSIQLKGELHFIVALALATFSMTLAPYYY